MVPSELPRPDFSLCVNQGESPEPPPPPDKRYPRGIPKENIYNESSEGDLF
jgi:hypothetical protein